MFAIQWNPIHLAANERQKSGVIYGLAILKGFLNDKKMVSKIPRTELKVWRVEECF